MIKKSIYCLLALLCVACGKSKTVSDSVNMPDLPTFSADSAYSYVEQQMAFGCRVPNSQSHTDCARFLQERLWQCGARVEVQIGKMTDYKGDAQDVVNIIGHFNEEKAGKTILLCAHYDTRPWADQERDPQQRRLFVPGANDGASGVAVLLEVARQIGDSSNIDRYNSPVDIVFFDCEDMGDPEDYQGVKYDHSWCLGSQYWSEQVKATQTADRYAFGLLLDMVGDPKATFCREGYSATFAPTVVERVWAMAKQAGYTNYFIEEKGHLVTDDHYYVNTVCGIACADIIHTNAGRQTGFPIWWHTTADDMNNISRETLKAVGQVVLMTIAN